MKNVIARLVLILCALGAPLVYAERCDTINAFGAQGWLPVSYINEETGQPEGIAYDVIRYAAKELNITLNVDTKTPWKRGVASLKRGYLDLVVAIYYTEARSHDFVYTEPFYHNEARVFIKSDQRFEFNDLADLLEYSGGIFLGGSYGDQFDRFVLENNMPVQKVKTKRQLVGMLLMGRTDYFILDYLDGMTYLKKEGLESQIQVLETPVAVNPVHFAVSRNSPCKTLVPDLNKLIAEAERRGDLQRIIKKHVPILTF
jgi:polar amino acid transport system substrate-binding protein